MSAPDTKQPIFDPGMDVATLVFSHVRCVKARLNLALVSKLWREASKPAAAYPLEFDWGAFPESWCPRGGEDIPGTRRTHLIRLLDNDEAVSLPYERVVGLIGEPAEHVRTSYSVCKYAAQLGSVRLLKWARVNNLSWNATTCCYAAQYGHLPALKYLHENGCPWSSYTYSWAANTKHWDCLQYMVDTKCPEWEWCAKEYAEHLR